VALRRSILLRVEISDSPRKATARVNLVLGCEPLMAMTGELSEYGTDSTRPCF
jgi:hypothetical protein